jgi:hypothetical protein
MLWTSGLRSRTTARVAPGGSAPAGQALGLREVRRHDRGQRKEPADEGLGRVVLQQLGARAGDQDRIDDERNRMTLEEVRDRLDDRAREEHAGLRSVDADVGEDGVQLRADERGRQLVHGGHGGRVLSGQRHEGARAVDACGGEGLHVGLDAGSAAGVGGGDRECARSAHALPSPA